MSERIRREAKADAVIELVAARTLFNRWVSADDVADALGLTRADLRAALDRRRGARPKRRGNSAPASVLDDLVLQALGRLGAAGPSSVRRDLESRGHRYSLAGVSDCLARLVATGRAARSTEDRGRGRYRRAA